MQSYAEHAQLVILQLRSLLSETSFEWLSVTEQSEVILPLVRIRGDEPCGFSSLLEQLDMLLDDLVPLSSGQSTELTVYLLRNPLRQLFTAPHPMLNTSTHRALSRPAGGESSRGDLHEGHAQQWKAASAQGCQNVLAWCAARLPGAELEKNIGVVLPPTLTMMDDWEPSWRVRGVLVLEAWMDKVPTEVLRRMGIDKLLLDSMIHTLSLHSPNGRICRVLNATIKLLDRTADGRKRADRLANIMQKGVIDGWQYAPSGADGRAVLIQVAEQVEALCAEYAMGEGIVRWLRVRTSHDPYYIAHECRISFPICSSRFSSRRPTPSCRILPPIFLPC